MTFLAFFVGVNVGIGFGLFWAGRRSPETAANDSHEDLSL